MQGIGFDGDTQNGPQPGDEKLFVQFYDGTRLDKKATEVEGRPIYKTVPWVKILIPGDRNSVIDTYADDTHIARFPRQWSQYKAKESQKIEGTLLSDTPFITRAQLQELEYFQVFTVEQLADANDNLATRIPIFHDLKRKAQTFAKQAKDSALAQKLASENEQKDARIAALEAEVKRISDMFDAAVRGQKEGNQGVEQQRSRNRSAVV